MNLPFMSLTDIFTRWFANANLSAFSCSFANLFSYFDTFLSVGLMNLPFMSLTDIFSSLIWRSLRITSLCRKNISPSKLYHLSKYSLTIFFKSSSLADSTSLLIPHRSLMVRVRSAAFLSCSFLSSSAAFFLSKVRNFFFLSGVINPFFFAILLVFCCVNLRCYKYLSRYGSEQRAEVYRTQLHNLKPD